MKKNILLSPCLNRRYSFQQLTQQYNHWLSNKYEVCIINACESGLNLGEI